jgi:ferredoxin
MRVEVDRDRCEGNAVCLADPVPVDQEELAEQSIAECPRAALLRRD